MEPMKLIYQNKYGSTYLLKNAPNPKCKIQLVVDTIGLFMCEEDLDNLLRIVHGSFDPCFCENCQGQACNKIWCSNALADICLKVNEPTLNLLDDLIKGTKFILNMNETLDIHRLSTEN